nr:carboxypeptidase-like regulatory domain-containing protein [Allomuricauda sp.]
MPYRSIFLTVVFAVFSIVFCSGQTLISGYVKETGTEQPLIGASVFFDGTTLGTVTNRNGFFELKKREEMTATLVVSHIGYKTALFDSVQANMGVVYLKPKLIELNEVVLEEDIWDRKKKMRIFLREFLGETRAARETTIANPQDLILHYSNSEKTMYAFANVPLQIKNEYLGYEINYVLENFKLIFSNSEKLDPKIERTFNTGKSFFVDKKGAKSIRRRKKVYQGSTLHFMRSLYQKKLKEESFKVYRNAFETDSYSVLLLEHSKTGIALVSCKEKELYITYLDSFGSLMKMEGNVFFIDSFGNHTSKKPILFGGDMGTKRIADLLPLDYEEQ